jgi:hypothetical protein
MLGHQAVRPACVARKGARILALGVDTDFWKWGEDDHVSCQVFSRSLEGERFQESRGELRRISTIID